MSKQTVPLSIAAPGFLGLNTENSGSILPVGWATKLDNCAIDAVGRVACRKGTRQVNGTTIESGARLGTIHEYLDGNNVSVMLTAANNKIFKEVLGTMTDVTSTATTPTGDDWQFVNFNDWVVGFQEGHNPIIATSATTPLFSDMGGTARQGAMGCSAYGRLWTVVGNTLYYSDLLIADMTDATGSSGNFDLAKFWPNGMDVATAIVDFNGLLVVFGRDSIIVYENADDVDNMSIVEGINGIGCIARDSVQVVGQDVLFLSGTGVRSLGRTLQDGSMPLTDISQHVRSQLLTSALAETSVQIKSAYDHVEGFYLLSLPSAGATYYFSIRFPNQDGSLKAAKWDYAASAFCFTQANELWMSRTGGFLSKYSGYRDEDDSLGAGGTSYDMDYEGVWNDLGEMEGVAPLLKIPKSVSLLAAGTAGSGVTFKWAVDYEDGFNSIPLNFNQNSVSRFGTATFTNATFTSSGSFERVRAQLSQSGQVLKTGLYVTIDGSSFALQRIDLLVKLGRLGI